MILCPGTSVENGIPFFSICIPQYNRTSFVIEALRALAGQSFKNFEVCVSDDCSSDGRQSELQQALRTLTCVTCTGSSRRMCDMTESEKQ